MPNIRKRVHLTKRMVDSTVPRADDVFRWDDEARGFGVRVRPNGLDEYDMPHGDLAPPHLIGLNRKLSLVTNLTDPKRYRGGDLLLKDVMGNVVAVPGCARAAR